MAIIEVGMHALWWFECDECGMKSVNRVLGDLAAHVHEHGNLQMLVVLAEDENVTLRSYHKTNVIVGDDVSSSEYRTI